MSVGNVDSVRVAVPCYPHSGSGVIHRSRPRQSAANDRGGECLDSDYLFSSGNTLPLPNIGSPFILASLRGPGTEP